MSGFELAIASLVRRKVPTAIALISISLSVGFSGLLFRLYLLSTARFDTIATGPQAVVGAKAGGLEILLSSLNQEGSFPDFIPFKLYASLQRREAVQFEDGARVEPNFIKLAIPFVYFGKYKDYRAVGTNETFMSQTGENAPALQDGKWAQGHYEVVLGAEVAREFAMQQRIVLTDWGADGLAPREVAMTVVGKLQPTGKATDRGIYTNLETAWERLPPTPDKGLHYFLIYVDPAGFPSLTALINRRTVAQVIDVGKEIEHLKTLTGAGRQLGFFLSFLILFLGALGVTAMMVTRFESMTVQLAVLRAMGYGKHEVRSWLLIEGALLGLAACVIGAVLDCAAFPVFRSLLGDALPLNSPNFATLYQSAWVWLFSLTGTTFAIYIPLFRLYHLDVHDALKG